MTLWIAWSALFSALVAVGAVAVERVAAHFGVARRIVWVVALALASVVPALLALRPTSIVETRFVDAPSVLPMASDRGPEAVTTLISPASAVVSKSSWIDLDVWVVRAWLFASLAYLTLLVRAMWQLRAQRSRWVEGTLGGCHVLIARDAGPAVVGVRRPRIVIPRWVLDADAATQSLLLRHETEHVRAGDSRVLFGAALLRMLFPWNAALWWMTRRLGLAIEIDCDARVVRAVGASHAYGLMLLAVGQRFAAAMPNSAFLSEPGTNLEMRILAMTKPRLRRPMAASIPFVAIAIGAVAIAAQTPRPKPLVPPRIIRVDSVPKLQRVEPIAPVVTVSPKRVRRAAAVPKVLPPRWIKVDTTMKTPPQIIVDPKPLPGNRPPRYPDELRVAQVEGSVFLTYSTDASGTPDTSTIRVIESADPAFTSAIRRVLPSWRYDTAGVVRAAFRFFFQRDGVTSADTLPAMATVDGVSVWPVVITVLPLRLRPSQGIGIPNTPAGRVLKAWLDAINSGDSAQMQEFHERYLPGSRPREARLRMQNDGPLDLVRIKTSEERTVEFVVRDRRRGGTNLAHLSLSSDDPPRITKFPFVFGRPDDSASWEELRRYVR